MIHYLYLVTHLIVNATFEVPSSGVMSRATRNEGHIYHSAEYGQL